MHKVAEDFTPNPINLLESNRSLGYSIEEAVSDLIDNSIAAKAKNISIHMVWNDSKPFFVLLDDGIGMSLKNNELIESFKLGSSNPLDERDPNDLGRFGFGMKTASLSQSKSFIVITKSINENLISRCLDLNYITKLNDGWKLRHVEKSELCGYDKIISNQKSGTAIIWNNWDKAPVNKNDFDSLSNIIYDYVSVCFHRFIERGINISCNNHKILACNPIPTNLGGAEQFSEVSLATNNDVKLSAYVIQHPMKWSENYEHSLSFNSYKLFSGFERQQGIYIYRCNRLLTPKGGWLGVLKAGNSAKLARVTIDYPNNADTIWSLDITKTNAFIPFEFVKEIKAFTEKIRKRSNIKINRGNRMIREKISNSDGRIWKESRHNFNESLKFILNKDHELIKTFAKENNIKPSEFNSFLDTISDCLPTKKIIENYDNDPSCYDRATINEKLDNIQLKFAKMLFENEKATTSKNKAFSYLMSMVPYCYHENQLKKYLNA